MPCNEVLKHEPEPGRGASRTGFDPAATGSGPHRVLIILLASLAALLVTLAGFFQPAAPLWFAGLPLLAGILRATPYARAGAMAAFMIWPAILCAVGLHNIGLPPLLIWPGAALTVATLAGLAGYIGVVAAGARADTGAGVSRRAAAGACRAAARLWAGRRRTGRAGASVRRTLLR